VFSPNILTSSERVRRTGDTVSEAAGRSSVCDEDDLLGMRATATWIQIASSQREE